jgi:hypothetical protein
MKYKLQNITLHNITFKLQTAMHECLHEQQQFKGGVEKRYTAALVERREREFGGKRRRRSIELGIGKGNTAVEGHVVESEQHVNTTINSLCLI